MRAKSLRIVIFVNDHVPGYVRVSGDGEAKINLRGADGLPDLIWADAMSRREVRRAMRIVTEHQTFLLARWGEIHGRVD